MHSFKILFCLLLQGGISINPSTELAPIRVSNAGYSPAILHSLHNGREDTVTFFDYVEGRSRTLYLRQWGAYDYQISTTGKFPLSVLDESVFSAAGINPLYIWLLKKLSPLEGGIDALRVGDGALISIGFFQASGIHQTIEKILAELYCKNPEVYHQLLGKHGLELKINTKPVSKDTDSQISIPGKQLYGRVQVFQYMMTNDKWWSTWLSALTHPAFVEAQLVVFQRDFIEATENIRISIQSDGAPVEIKVSDAFDSYEVKAVLIFCYVLRPVDTRKLLNRLIPQFMKEKNITSVKQLRAYPPEQLLDYLSQHADADLKRRISSSIQLLKKP